MPALTFILTTAGKNAIVNANNTGTNPITIAKVGIGSASWTPTIAATSLNTEIKKITTIGGAAVADDTIHVTASDTTSDVYTVREIGLFTSDNTLVAVYSQADPIITKGAATVALIAADLVITGIPAGSITVGDVGFDYPQATESVKGVAELATTGEAQAGTDDERIITPLKLQQVTATETRKGVVELATAAEVQTGTDTERAVTPAGLAARTATESRTGVAEIATTIEAQAGTDDTRIITPLKLQQVTASETRKGVVELATASEVQIGTDTLLAVTPAGLSARTATESRTGVIELATTAEVEVGTDTLRAVTPATLKTAPPAAKAWVNFDGVTTIPVRSSYNVTSITDLGNAGYYINLTQPVAGTGAALAVCGMESNAVGAVSNVGVSAFPVSDSQIFITSISFGSNRQRIGTVCCVVYR